MADPFLALTLDAKRRIAQVASALQHPHPGGAAWGLLEVLEDVWRRKDPAVSAELLAASFGPDPRVGPMLVAFRFLAVVGDGAWMLAREEADRLLLTHKQRVAAGKARSSSAGRSAGGSFQRRTSGPPAADQRATSGGPALTPSTQHPAPSTTTEDLRTPSAPPAAAEVLALVPTDPDVKPPRKRSEAQEFWSWYQRGRTELTGLVAEAEPNQAALNAWFKGAVGEVGLPRLRTAAARFVKFPKDTFWQERGFPFRGFMSDNVWRQYVPPEERSG